MTTDEIIAAATAQSGLSEFGDPAILDGLSVLLKSYEEEAKFSQVGMLVASSSSGLPGSTGHLYLLDGRTGTQTLRITTAVDATVTPALGDLDHDGLPEIVTVGPSGRLLAFA